MKIFYAVQATGNGHIARAKELLPYLSQYADVDVFLSGANSSLQPGFPVKYRSKGLSFFYNPSGGLDYKKTIKSLRLYGVWKDAKELPLEKYDLIINDFESITALACQLKKCSSVALGHQASFLSNKTPRPDSKDLLGEWVLRHYAKADKYLGFHFKNYDDFIFPPIVKESIKKANVKNEGHITVYLPHYGNLALRDTFSKFKDVSFEIFSPFIFKPYEEENLKFFPIDNVGFSKSMIKSEGVITGAGFETPAETLYLGKKLMCIPIKKQYEQLCNAESLKSFGVPILGKIEEIDSNRFYSWLEQKNENANLIQCADNKVVVDKMIQQYFQNAYQQGAIYENMQPLQSIH
ncbi:glycosyltransferase family protein [Rhizosphaericola mali]|uniref:Glycosyl transferase n=1 Tax=Rhizosphaericola mali TaxID=2545455 RepID=A0A5P2G324_9BACT|nr:glycosyltransferase family protein [Rhizosphaericola mali]QES88222.1 glycosyl transferase [Rhizosphaericola mali]